MFEGWASDFLASYLGQFLDVQREKLRISLWSAWRTGLTLTNIHLRPDALDHLTLPFKITSSNIGCIQAQVPWRALRSPVVVELSDVYICIAPLSEEELKAQPAADRSWAAKQAALAALELQALAGDATIFNADTTTNGAAASGDQQQQQQGILWSLLRHVIGMLINRLQLSIKNIHIRYEDDVNNRSFGIKLNSLHSCLPGETEHASVLLAEDAGVSEHSSAAARHSVQKQLAITGVQVYWNTKELLDSTEAPLIGPLDAVIHCAATMKKDTKLHVAGVISSGLSITVSPEQVKDIVHWSDEMKWLGLRSKYAALRPDSLSTADTDSNKSDKWQSVWKYAVDAVLSDIQGPRRAARWKSSSDRQQQRARYIELYTLSLEREKKLQLEQQQQLAMASSQSVEKTSSSHEEVLSSLDRFYSAKEGGGSLGSSAPDALAESTLSAESSIPEDSAISIPDVIPGTTTTPSKDDDLISEEIIQLEKQLSIQDIIQLRMSARQNVAATASSTSTTTPAATTNNQKLLGRGLANAVRFLGFIGVPGKSTAVMLPGPSESEVQELYEAVDFHPDKESMEDQEEDMMASTSSISASGGVELSLHCLVSHTKVTLVAGDEAVVVELQSLKVETHQSSAMNGSSTVDVAIKDVKLLDGGNSLVLSRAPTPSDDDNEEGATTTTNEAADEDGTQSPPPPLKQQSLKVEEPVIKLRYSLKPKTSTRRALPTLDILVQALQIQNNPSCFMTLASFTPPTVADSFSSREMHAVNGLESVARAMIEAQRLAALGPGVDMAVKILDIGLIASNSSIRDVSVHTGAITIQSGGKNKTPSAQALYNTLSRVIKQRSHSVSAAQDTQEEEEADTNDAAVEDLEEEGGGELDNDNLEKEDSADVEPDNTTAAASYSQITVGAGDADEEQAKRILAAVHAVEDQLAYQRLNIFITALQASSTTIDDHGFDTINQVLKKTKAVVKLRMHRLTADYSSAPVVCAISLDPISAELTDELVQLFVPAVYSRGAGSSGTDTVNASSDQSEERKPVPIAVELDLRMAAVDISYKIPNESASYNISLRSANIHLDVYEDANVAAKVNISGLSYQDLSTLPVPPVLHPGVVPHLVGMLSIEALHVSTDSDAVNVQLVDVAALGFQEETGNFISRLDDQQPNYCTVVVDTSTRNVSHTSVSVSNTVLGHAIILRIVTMVMAMTTDTDGGGDNNSDDSTSSTVDVDLHDCRIVWKYRPIPQQDSSIPATLHDALSVHQDVAAVGFDHLSLHLPLIVADNDDELLLVQDEKERVLTLEGLTVSCACMGYANYPSLPLLVVPHVTVTRSISSGTSPGIGFVVESRGIDIGLHPSHLLVGATLVQLYQHEVHEMTASISSRGYKTESEISSHPPNRTESMASTGSGTISAAHGAEEAVVVGSSQSTTAAIVVDSNNATVNATTPSKLDITVSIDSIGVSLLGSTHSSACLKLQVDSIGLSYSAATIVESNTTSSTRSDSYKVSFNGIGLYNVQRKSDAGFEFTPFGGQSGGFQMTGVAGGSELFVTGSPDSEWLMPPVSMRSLQPQGPASSSAGARRNLAGRLGLATGLDSSGPSLRYQTASSIVSRYFSAADSEFEDARSEMLDGAKSPIAGGGQSSPRESILPLKLDSPDVDVSTLATLKFSDDVEPSSRSAGVAVQLQSVTATIEQASDDNYDTTTTTTSSIDADVDILVLRVYLHGWEGAASCFNTYTVFSKQAMSHITAASTSASVHGGTHHHVTATTTASHVGVVPNTPSHSKVGSGSSPQRNQPVTPPLSPAPSLQHPQQQGGGDHDGSLAAISSSPPAADGSSIMRTSEDEAVVVKSVVMINVAGFRIEAVAAAGHYHCEEQDADADDNDEEDFKPMPVGLVHIASSVKHTVYTSGSAITVVGIDSLLISTSLLALSEITSLDLHDREAALVQDALVGLHAGGITIDGVHESTVVGIGQISVWASQKNAAVTVALAQHAQHMMTSLSSHTGMHMEHEMMYYDASTGRGSPSAMLAGPLRSLTLTVDTLAVLLSFDDSSASYSSATTNTGSSSPLLELSTSCLSASLKATEESLSWTHGQIAMQLQLDVFNGSKMSWEPVVEPWPFTAELNLPSLPSASSSSSSSTHHFTFKLMSEQGIECTVSEPAVEACCFASIAAQVLESVAAEPDTLEERLKQDAAQGTASGTEFKLYNLTGSSLEIWLDSPLSSSRSSSSITATEPTLQIVSGGVSVLPVLEVAGGLNDSNCDGSSRLPRGRCSGVPSIHQGVLISTTDATPNTSLNSSTNIIKRRTLMYFRVVVAGREEANPGPVTGPIQLDTAGQSLYKLTDSSNATVMCETVAAPRGGYTVKMHSGVVVRNTSQIEMEVGLTQSPMGLPTEIVHLATLKPNKYTWVPVRRVASASVCIRPIANATTAAPSSLIKSASALKQHTSSGLKPPVWSIVKNKDQQVGSSKQATGLYPSSSGVFYSSGHLSPQRARSTQELLGTSTSGSGNIITTPLGSGSSSVQQLQYSWSNTVALSSLLQPNTNSSSNEPGAQLRCSTASDVNQPILVCVGAAGSASGSSAVREVLLSAPLTLHNTLPVPVEATISALKGTIAQRVRLDPNTQQVLHHIDGGFVDSVLIHAAGYHPTDPIPIPSTSQYNCHVALKEVGPSQSSVEISIRHGIDTATGSHTIRLACSMWLFNCAGIPIALRQGNELDMVGVAVDTTGIDTVYPEDHVPEGWVAPLALPHWHTQSMSASPASTRMAATPRPRSAGVVREFSLAPPSPYISANAATATPTMTGQQQRGNNNVGSIGELSSSTAKLNNSNIKTTPMNHHPNDLPSSSSHMSVPRMASSVDVSGLGEILEAEALLAYSGSISTPLATPRVGNGGSNERSTLLGSATMTRAASRARGIADSMITAPAFETPSRWPSMYSGLEPRNNRLRLQLRMTTTKALLGDKPYWSDAVDLDTNAASGGAAVAVLPSPGSTVASSSNHRAAYPITLSISPIPGSDGAMALCLLPRFVLKNTLDVPMQYKQSDTGQEKELLPGTATAVRWTDASRPQLLCVRVQEAGWLWSGAFTPDAPGDLFVKIRHRDRGITMLVRVDVAVTSTGVVVITLSHHPAGFAPYRIENCSLETLHARQLRVMEQQDVLRPYCSLNYAWDEPSLPHRLVLELPGARQLGTFDLDKVGQDVTLPVKRTRRGEPERQLRVLVRAEGPTRVLTVLDPQLHPLVLPATKSSSSEEAMNTAITTTTYTGLMQWEVSVQIPSLGLSLVSPRHELAYFRAGDIDCTIAASSARYTLSLDVGSFRLDIPSPFASFPVAFAVPAPPSMLTSTVKTVRAAAQQAQRKNPSSVPGLSVKLAIWQRRPAGVLCAEHVVIDLPSLALYVEQQELLELIGHVGSMLLVSKRVLLQRRNNRLKKHKTIIGSDSAINLQKLPSSSSSSSNNGPLVVDGAPGTTPTEQQQQAEDATATTTTPIGLVGGASQSSSTAVGIASSVETAVAASDLQLLALPHLESLLDELGYTDTTTSASGVNATDNTAATKEYKQQQQQLRRSQKVYIDVLALSPVTLTVSFLAAPYRPSADSNHRLAALQRLLSLVDVEDAVLWLSGFQLRSPLMDQSALLQQLQRHYTRAMLQELYKVVGSVSMFGDPVRLVQHLGLGVWAFLASPAAGLVESARQRGPRHFLLGILGGTRGLFQNVVFAISNAATKASAAARKAIVVVGLESDSQVLQMSTAAALRRQSAWHHHHRALTSPRGANIDTTAIIDINDPTSTGQMIVHQGAAGPSNHVRRAMAVGDLANSGGGLIAAALQGAIGLISEPVRGMDEQGLVGLLRGLRRGATGAVALPLIALLEMSARLADSVRSAVAGSSNLGWTRPPRYVNPNEPLRAYAWDEAMGRWLLAELVRFETLLVLTSSSDSSDSSTSSDGVMHTANTVNTASSRSSPTNEAFVLCVAARDRDSYVVVTASRVLYMRAKGVMWTPEVLWQSNISDIQLAMVDTTGHQQEDVVVQHIDNEQQSNDDTMPLVVVVEEEEQVSRMVVRIIAHQPQRALRLVGSSMARSRMTSGRYHMGSIPFTFLLLECRKEEQCAELVDAIKALQDEYKRSCFVGDVQRVFTSGGR